MTITRLIVCCVVLMLGWTTLARTEESLAEAARKEKERRESLKGKPAQEFTNEDLDSDKNDEKADSARPPRSSTESSSDGAEKVAAVPSEEESWRERSRVARAAVAEAKKRVTDLEAAYTRVGTQRLASTDTMEILALREKERQLQEDIEQARKGVSDQEKRLRELEGEAREQHVPPGWLRE